MLRLHDALAVALGGRVALLIERPVTATTTVPSYGIEIFNAGCGKGKALAHLADLLGVLLSETMAVGDYENDLSMLDAVRTAGGVAVAMANAVPLVKEAATAFVASNDADGVAEAFARFVEEHTRRINAVVPAPSFPLVSSLVNMLEPAHGLLRNGDGFIPRTHVVPGNDHEKHDLALAYVHIFIAGVLVVADHEGFVAHTHHGARIARSLLLYLLREKAPDFHNCAKRAGAGRRARRGRAANRTDLHRAGGILPATRWRRKCRQPTSNRARIETGDSSELSNWLNGSPITVLTSAGVSNTQGSSAGDAALILPGGHTCHSQRVLRATVLAGAGAATSLSARPRA